MGTGKEQKISITGSSGLSKDEVDKMTKDAEAHAEDDRKAKGKDRAAQQRRLGRLCCGEDDPRPRRQVDAAKKTEIEEEVKKVKDALAKDDTDAIKAASESLNTKVQAVSAELYKQAAAQAGAAGAGSPEGAPQAQTPPDSASAAKDDVVDADFEMVDKDDKKGKN